MTRVQQVGLFITTLAIAACSDSPTENIPNDFTYNVQITGAVSQTLRGPAAFASGTDDGGEAVFGFLLGQDTSQHLIFFGKRGADRPGVGTYTIDAPDSDRDWTAAMVVANGEELLGMFVAGSGKVIVEESTVTRVRGRIEFAATGFLGDDLSDEKTITVKGTFDAKPGEVIQASRLVSASSN